MDEELLLEAVYLFNEHCILKEAPEGKLLQIKSDLPNNIFKAIMRILIVNKIVLNQEDNYFFNPNNLFNELKEKIKKENISDDMKNLAERIKSDNPFFKELSDFEYEIYSKCNFPVAFKIGESLSHIIDFSNASILDIGGNSGGLSSAILTCYPLSNVTIVDKNIPCAVGNEYKKENNFENLTFVTQDFFNLNLNKSFDYIILSNILHDYNDQDCIRILEICKNHSSKSTKILILEDILINEYEPVDVLEHGLRLSVNTICGKQRTIEDLKRLMKMIDMHMIKQDSINKVQTVTVFQSL